MSKTIEGYRNATWKKKAEAKKHKRNKTRRKLRQLRQPFDQSTSQDTPGFVECFRVHP